MTDPLAKLTTQAKAPPAHIVEHANCRGVNPDLFFPVRGESPTPAKQVCAGCDVREECLEFALVNNEQFGIFGGTTPKTRRRLRRQRGLAGDPVGGPHGSLPYAKVVEIRVDFQELWEVGHPQVYATLMARHGVSRQMLGNIVTGRSYQMAGGPIHTPIPGRGRHGKPGPRLEVVS